MSDEPSGAPEPHLTCFVIGPIGNRLAAVGSPERETYEEGLRVMEEVVAPASTSVGLSPVRADGLARAGEITEQIFKRLRDDDVVIADLTGANANVMYELGLRHTKDKLTVQIGEFGRLPFDVNMIRTIRFSRSPVGLINARDELIQVLAAGLAGEFDPVTATRVWNEGDSTVLVPAESPDELVELQRASDDDGERGFLDIMVEAEARQDEMVEALEAVGSHIVALGDLATASAAEMDRSNAAGQGMRGRLQVATRYASGLDQIASALEGDVERYVGAIGSVSAGWLEIIKSLENDPSQLDEPEAASAALNLRGLANITRTSLGSLSGMVEAINENAKLSRVLRGPSSRLTSAFDEFVQATSTIDDWDRRLQSLGVPSPPEDLELASDDSNFSSEEVDDDRAIAGDDSRPGP
jgi:hypothetical protein